MADNSKLCCWLSWNFFFRFFVWLFLLGIPFGLYKFEQITIAQLITGFGAVIGFYLFYYRNKIFEMQLIQQSEHYHKDSKFKSFIETTKMLTDENSSSEAKISAMYLLYDIAMAYKDDSERIIQVLNKQLTPLVKCIENNCETDKYKKELVKILEIKNCQKQKIQELEYSNKKNKLVTIESIDSNSTKQIIKEWMYKGNSTETVVANALFILKKIIVSDVILNANVHINISNTIIFDIDTDFDKDVNLKSKEKPTENLIFLHCKLEKVDFSNTKYHFCRFINCNFEKSNFENSNLWGTKFINCDFKDVKFSETECEGVEFIGSINLSIEQIQSMKFKNIQNSGNKRSYLIIYDKEKNNKNNLREDLSCFKDENEYKNWKNES